MGLNSARPACQRTVEKSGRPPRSGPPPKEKRENKFVGVRPPRGAARLLLTLAATLHLWVPLWTLRPFMLIFPSEIELFFMEVSDKSARIAAMRPVNSMISSPNRRVAFIALLVVALDQLAKQLIWRFLPQGAEVIVLEGFFKLVHWGNTGAAWSLFRDNNFLLAMVAIVALIILFLSRHHFDSRTLLGQTAFGLIIGGIIGNLIDRLWAKHVIDFLYFYVQQRRGGEVGFPAFNVADSAICTGVLLVFLLTWRNERAPKAPEPAPTK